MKSLFQTVFIFFFLYFFNFLFLDSDLINYLNVYNQIKIDFKFNNFKPQQLIKEEILSKFNIGAKQLLALAITSGNDYNNNILNNAIKKNLSFFQNKPKDLEVEQLIQDYCSFHNIEADYFNNSKKIFLSMEETFPPEGIFFLFFF